MGLRTKGEPSSSFGPAFKRMLTDVLCALPGASRRPNSLTSPCSCTLTSSSNILIVCRAPTLQGESKEALSGHDPDIAFSRQHPSLERIHPTLERQRPLELARPVPAVSRRVLHQRPSSGSAPTPLPLPTPVEHGVPSYLSHRRPSQPLRY
jgi:hypothetical protein